MGKSPKKQNVIKGALYGALGGAGASFVMDCYWGVVRNAMGDRPEQKPKGGKQQKDEPSTQIIADKVSEAATGHEIPKKSKAAAGVGVHYATGIGFGLPFGALSARKPGLGLLAGLVYGIVVWLVLDEGILRLLKIGPAPDEVPVSQHMQALGAHLVYGGATALITRLLLKLL